MSLLATIRGTTAGTGANITYTFNSSVDTTTLQPGQPFDLRTYLYSIGAIRNLNITTRLNVIIPPGVALGSSDPYKSVMTVAGFKARDKVTIINQGAILGAGGYGGAGTGLNGNGNAGVAGGNGLVVYSPITLNNSGYIYGGGGGGGSGSGSVGFYAYGYPYCWNCNGTSPCGSVPSPNCGCWCCYKCKQIQCTYLNQWTCYVDYDGYGGAGGTGQGAYTAAAGGNAGNGYGGGGGAGGTYGNYGATGSYASYDTGTVPGPGGAPGYYIIGSANLLSYTNTGSVLGLIA